MHYYDKCQYLLRPGPLAAGVRVSSELSVRRILDDETLHSVDHLRGVKPITLVLGAGVSCGRGVPDWPTLAERVWKEAFSTPYPFASGASGYIHPFGHQFALELVECHLHSNTAQQTPNAFAAALTRAIYSKVCPPAAGVADTLSVLVRLLRREGGRREGRQIRSVITLNVDSLIEDEVHRGRRPRIQMTSTGRKAVTPLVWPVSRASDDASRAPDAIPIYHLHGFLPSPSAKRRRRKTSFHQLYDQSGDTLVFTDWQYWKLSTTPAGFANRVVSTALHESHCIFVGLSFADVNLLRWLGMRSVELSLDLQGEFGMDRASTSFLRGYRMPHAWIRPDSADPSGVVSEVLALRGIRSIRIDSWQSKQFMNLMKHIFGKN